MTKCYRHIAPSEVGTGFVFICPGQREEINNRPCAGQTGEVLEIGLRVMNRLDSKMFPYTDRYQYHITNAWSLVEYPRKTGRSVPKKSEVCDVVNLRRLHLEIRDLECVIVCGAKARDAVSACIEEFGFAGKVAYAKHTSRRALGFPTNESLPQVMNTWAQAIIFQLQT